MICYKDYEINVVVKKSIYYPFNYTITYMHYIILVHAIHLRTCAELYYGLRHEQGLRGRMALAVKCFAFFFTVLWSLLIGVRITFSILKHPVAAFRKKIRNSKQSAHGKLELIHLS